MKSARIQTRANYQQRNQWLIYTRTCTGNGGWFDWTNSRQFLAIADFIELALKSAWLSATPTVDQQRHGSLPRGNEGTVYLTRSIDQRANLPFAISSSTDFFHLWILHQEEFVVYGNVGFQSAFCISQKMKKEAMKKKTDGTDIVKSRAENKVIIISKC